MNRHRLIFSVGAFCFLLVLVVSSLAMMQVQSSSYSSTMSTLPKIPSDHGLIPYSPRSSFVFNFVSNFENMQLDGWQSESGSVPVIVSNPNYSGEPALQSSAWSGNQIDY